MKLNKPLYAVYDLNSEQFAYLDMKWVKLSGLPRKSSCKDTQAEAQAQLERLMSFIKTDLTHTQNALAEYRKQREPKFILNLWEARVRGARRLRRTINLAVVKLSAKKA